MITIDDNNITVEVGPIRTIFSTQKELNMVFGKFGKKPPIANTIESIKLYEQALITLGANSLSLDKRFSKEAERMANKAEKIVWSKVQT